MKLKCSIIAACLLVTLQSANSDHVVDVTVAASKPTSLQQAQMAKQNKLNCVQQKLTALQEEKQSLQDAGPQTTEQMIMREERDQEQEQRKPQEQCQQYEEEHLTQESLETRKTRGYEEKITHLDQEILELGQREAELKDQLKVLQFLQPYDSPQKQ